jgi:response regulator RpfG family c-di-GMP phosphodiesterase
MKSRLLILIVDEGKERTSVSKQIREAGYRVVVARDAAEARSLIPKDRPDLIVAFERAGQDLVSSLDKERLLVDCPPVLLVGGRDPKSGSPCVTKFLLQPVTREELVREIQKLAVTPAQPPETD